MSLLGLRGDGDSSNQRSHPSCGARESSTQESGLLRTSQQTSPLPSPGKKPDPSTKLTFKVLKEGEVRAERWYQVSCEKFQPGKS